MLLDCRRLILFVFFALKAYKLKLQTMSRLHSSEHIHLPSDAEYFADLGHGERLAYMSFYLSITDPDYRQRQETLGELWQAKPPRDHQLLLHNMYKTTMNTLYITGATMHAHDNPDDHIVVAAELREGEMHVDHLEVLGISYSRTAVGSLYKRIDAKWNETSKITSIQFGNGSATLLEQGPESTVYMPLETVEPMQPPSRFTRSRNSYST